MDKEDFAFCSVVVIFDVGSGCDMAIEDDLLAEFVKTKEERLKADWASDDNTLSALVLGDVECD